jgi:MATE family multidrug resistance protein
VPSETRANPDEMKTNRAGATGAAGADSPDGGLTEPGSEIGLGAGADASREPSLAEIESHPLREMFAIAAPTIVTMTSYTVMQFIDALMVKDIGPEPVYVSAQGNGGIIAWVTMSLLLGLTTVVNSYVSQNLGAGTPREGAAYAWNALWLSVAGWIALLLPMALLAPAIFGIAALGHSEQLQQLETAYAQIVLVGGVLTLGGRALGHYFYGMHRPVVVMVAVLTGNCVNVFANWVLIFGNLGAPELGVAGAALGTVIGTAFELSIPLVIFLSARYAREFGTRSAWRVSKKHLADIVRIGWPGALMFANEMICWTLLMVALIPRAAEAAGESPTLANTAGWIGLKYMHLSFMPTVGLSIAVTAIVGKCMGMGRPDLAASRTWLAFRLGLIYMGICGVIFFAFREPLVDVFISDETSPEDRSEIIRFGSYVLIAAAIFQIFDAVAIILSGALRGAGDTVWPGVATLVLSWTCLAGIGFLLIEVAPGLGSASPWIGAAVFLIALGIAMLVRFCSGKWRTMRLVRDEPGA